MTFCPKCGNERTNTLRYCAKCGFDFWKAAAGEPVSPSSSAPPGAPSATSSPGPPDSGGRSLGFWLGVAIAVVVVGFFGYSYLADKTDQIYSNVAGDLAGRTPSPTRRATDTSVPTPDTTPQAAFEPIHLEGSGSAVPRFTIPESAPGLAQIAASGSGNFVVWSVSADGAQNDLLVNVIGTYSGTILFDESDGIHSTAFQVEADGPWTIDVQPISAAFDWDGSQPLVGRGDDVATLEPRSSGLKTVAITHNGSSNFVVYAYSSSAGASLLVNEISTYSGEVVLPDGTFFLEINADGNWSVGAPS